MLNKIQQKKLLKASADVVTQFLRKYSKAGQQIHLLDDYTTRLTSQAILAMKSGNKGRALQLLKRRCVADGIKHMYRQYRQTKLAQAKTLALSVAGTLGHPAPLPIRPTDNHTGVEEIQVEKFAQTMMVAQCNFTRNG
ncbi:uncharacterized protein [Magallana gigas]|uniref:uncharacterized protein isoform X1 n=1 Tax=Magallana gigas TaxID=29159 RepID=UPI0005C3A057|nr:uncharacterized protein LOC105345479 isoform X1 [Crassostrea gigas]|eukprot:XP_011451910.1 PREDICTED: uncharacterized protein LOC105345479 isoform X1 [Crassostrea gigas]